MNEGAATEIATEKAKPTSIHQAKCILRKPLLVKPVDRAKLLSDRAYYSPKLHNKISSPQQIGEKQLLTFSKSNLWGRPSQLNQKEQHETALRKELEKFRSEIESKFKNSVVNPQYRFPRPADSDNSDEEWEESKENGRDIMKLLKVYTKATGEVPPKKKAEEHQTYDSNCASPRNVNPRIHNHRKVVSSYSPSNREISVNNFFNLEIEKINFKSPKRIPILASRGEEKKWNSKTISKKQIQPHGDDGLKGENFKRDFTKYIAKKQLHKSPLLQIGSSGKLLPNNTKKLALSPKAVQPSAFKLLQFEPSLHPVNFSKKTEDRCRTSIGVGRAKERTLISLEKLLDKFKEKTEDSRPSFGLSKAIQVQSWKRSTLTKPILYSQINK